MRSCVVQVIIQQHDIMVTSTNLGLVFPCLYELFGGGVAMVRMQPGVGSVEQAKVFVRGLIAIAKQMTRMISCCHDISPCSKPVRTSPW